MNQIKHHIGGGNYFLLWPKHPAEEIESTLRAKGILIRNMKGKNLIDGSIRVSIGIMNQMQTFLKAFIEADKI